MIVATAAFDNGADSKFYIVLTIAISTTLMSDLWIFPAALKLRFNHGHVERPYRLGEGNGLVIAAAAMTTFWAGLGTWVGLFPGTLENLFGVDYDFLDTWGTSRATYETLTLGTLAIVFLVAVLGYASGKSVRNQQADLPIGSEKA